MFEACIIGFFIDLVLGDPYWFTLHPIRLIGRLISFMEKLTRKLFPDTNKGCLLAGGVTAIVVTFISTAIPAIIIIWCNSISYWLSLAVQSTPTLSSSRSFSTLIGAVLQLVLPSLQPGQG